MGGSADISKKIMAQISAAMNEANYLALQDMHEGLDYFYSGGTPVKYKRTGQLMNTPKVSSVMTGGKTSYFRAWLDRSGGYTTGKRPSMATVLQLTNNGGLSGYRPAVGSPGYWEYAENLIEDSVDSVFSKYFG